LSRYGRQEYRSDDLSIRALLDATLDSMQQSIANSGAQVIIAGSLPNAGGDHTAIEQVFSNLIGNALKYLDPARPGHIEIGGEQQPPLAHYWVRDNGAGIPTSAHNRLFQVFQRFHPELAPGEGMGLAIVKRVIERHGGRIWVESQEGTGTTFHFTLRLPASND
jgi:signal transduction histidine kinase